MTTLHPALSTPPVVERMLSTGDWTTLDESRCTIRVEQAVGRTTQRGEVVRDHNHALDLLAAGHELSVGEDWYNRVRYQRQPRPTVAAVRPRFTCPRCGEHRDTTVGGQCDDCEA